MNRLYFPLIGAWNAAYGVQIEMGGVSAQKQYLAPKSWVKRRINWSHTSRNGWAHDDNDINQIPGYPLLLTVHNAPIEYLIDPDKPCGPFFKANWSDYGDFIVMIIDRYSAGRTLWIELWNEPDATESMYPDLFGCWPDNGQLYSEMVQYVYGYVKKRRPETMIYCGALAGVRYAGLLPKCDGVSIHVYPRAQKGPAGFDVAGTFVDLMKSLGHKRVLISETSCLYAQTDIENETQAQYWDYLWSMRNVVAGVFWYTLANNGWANSDMIDKNAKKPVWYRYAEDLR